MTASPFQKETVEEYVELKEGEPMIMVITSDKTSLRYTIKVLGYEGKVLDMYWIQVPSVTLLDVQFEGDASVNHMGFSDIGK